MRDWMGGRVDGWMDGWMGWMDGWTDGEIDGQTARQIEGRADRQSQTRTHIYLPIHRGAAINIQIYPETKCKVRMNSLKVGMFR
jgi:hypothetical protein